MSKYFRKNVISIAIQNAAIMATHKDFVSNCTWTKGIWEGIVKPTPLNKGYLLRFEYVLDNLPKVRVISPQLQLYPGSEKVHHTYAEDEPCVYYPKAREWTPEKLIVRTVIPWSALWLSYYEVWLATGEWLGGGIHPKKA